MLFTDLVDSTSLMSRLGPEAADEFRRKHFQSLRDAIDAHEGHEVKNTGDGLMVTFERPSDAAACAVDMQRQTSRFGKRRPEGAIAIRIGLAVGEATTEDGDWFGIPVIEAARLSAVAEPGEILATDVVRVLSGGRAWLDFTGRAAMTLKGLSDPVNVVAVGWQADAREVQLPPLLESMGGGYFVGRDLEAAKLTAAWKTSLEGRRQAVLVAGEPGIGKTRLARELAATAQAAGATILYGRCDEELGLAYQPFVEALDPYVATCPRDLLHAHVSVWGGELARILAELPRRVPEAPEPVKAEPDVERHRLFEAVAALLAAADDGAGVVLILDDLHWADKGTLLMLRHLLHTGEPVSLVLIGTYRDTDLSRSHPLAEMLADLRRQDGVERIALSGLDPAGVEALVEAAAGQQLDEGGIDLARAVHDETEGNPFFVGQVLRHLTESGAIYQRDGAWAFDGDVSQLGIPEGVREVIGRRLSRLSERANTVLRTAAVVGREFPLALVAEVAEVDEDDAVDALDEATGARLVVEVNTNVDLYSFTHALVRESLYDELSTSRRVRLHKRVGLALERKPESSLAALAHHFCEAAATGEVHRAAEYGLRAGQEALASLAHDDAVGHFARSLEVLDAASADDTITRGDLLVGLAEARNAAGDLEPARAAALEAAQIARRLDDGALFARAALAACVGFPPVPDADAEALLDEALSRVGDADSMLRSRVLGTLAQSPSSASGRGPKRRDELSAEALAVARRIDDEDALVWALASRHDAIAGPATVEERLALSQEMLEHSSGRFVGFGHVYLCINYCELGDPAAAQKALDTYRAVCEQLRIPGGLTWARIWKTGFLLFAGRLAEAEASLMGWFGERRGINDDISMQSFGAQFFDLRRAQGRCEEVEPAVRSLAQDHPENPAWQTALVMLLSELDQRDEAGELFDHIAMDDFALIRADAGGFILNVALVSEACAYLGDRHAQAKWLYDALEPYAGRNIVVGAIVQIGAASRYLGRLAATMERWDDARDHFEDALAMNERMGAQPWLARTACEYAAMLQLSGLRTSRSPDHLLTLARSLADEIGMPVVARQVGRAPPLTIIPLRTHPPGQERRQIVSRSHLPARPARTGARTRENALARGRLFFSELGRTRTPTCCSQKFGTFACCDVAVRLSSSSAVIDGGREPRRSALSLCRPLRRSCAPVGRPGVFVPLHEPRRPPTLPTHAASGRSSASCAARGQSRRGGRSSGPGCRPRQRLPILGRRRSGRLPKRCGEGLRQPVL